MTELRRDHLERIVRRALNEATDIIEGRPRISYWLFLLTPFSVKDGKLVYDDSLGFQRRRTGIADRISRASYEALFPVRDIEQFIFDALAKEYSPETLEEHFCETLRMFYRHFFYCLNDSSAGVYVPNKDEFRVEIGNIATSRGFNRFPFVPMS